MRARRLAVVGAGVAPVVALAGCSSSAVSAAGTWGTPSSQGKPYLELKTGGALSGSDGCNRLTGTWTQSGDDVTFGHLASTLIACQGVDTWLSKAHSATIKGSTMRVLDDDKQDIGTLTKSN